MNKSKISICIPTYNGERYLRECLDTVLVQSYKNIEVVIVDDKSTDSTIAIVDEYLKKDNRIKLHQNEYNLGLVGNWNKCIELAGGEWIKFVFQDDYILPDCIEKMINNVQAEDSLIACKRTFLVDDDADDKTKKYYENEVVTFEKLGIPSGVHFISPEKISNMAAENICMNFIGEPTSIMFKKSLTSTIGSFNNDLAQICDLEFCLRIAANYGVTYISEPLTRFRIHELSTTSSNINEKLYTLSNIDPIITVRQLLYDERYSNFRSYITHGNRIKLLHFMAVRVYEAHKVAESAGVESDEMKKFNTVAKKYPEINKLRNPNLNIKLLYKLVRLRRKIRAILK